MSYEADTPIVAAVLPEDEVRAIAARFTGSGQIPALCASHEALRRAIEARTEEVFGLRAMAQRYGIPADLLTGAGK